MNAPEGNSYRHIVKSTTVLGGSSLINVALGVLRTKLLALQLGPAMFGTMGLYTAITAMIGGVASLGIGQSAVREIAAAAGTQDEIRIARTIRAYRRLVWVTGFAGLLMTLVLALPASSWTFGNFDHAWAIAALAVTVLFAEIQAGQNALLQGLRRIRELAAINITGAVWSTLLAVPIVLCFGERGIVPFLISVVAGQMAASWWYARKVRPLKVSITWRETWDQSRGMVQLGLAFVVTGLAASASVYVIRVTINRFVGAAGVGLYQAAFTVCSVYVGFVLQAMSGDYYPRLAGTGDDVARRNQLVNEQAEMAVLLAVPGLVAALVLSNLIIWVMYSNRFSEASAILRWQVLGLFGRIISWPMGFILLARADKKAFLWTEIAASVVHVGLVFAGIAYFGIPGAGAAFAVLYAFHVALIYGVVRRRHGYICRGATKGIIIAGVLMVGAAFGTTFIASPTWRLTLGMLVLAVAAFLSLRKMLGHLGHEQIAATTAAAGNPGSFIFRSPS
jgi:antigen flippase